MRMTRPSRSTSWLLVTAVLLALALMSASAPTAVVQPQRSTIDVIVAPDDGALDESAATPGVCPVFCSTDEFCNRGCPTDSLCRNHRCLQF